MTLRELLTAHGLSAYVDAFEAQHVPVSDLPHLTDEDLREDFGVASYVDRKRFRAMVASLAGGSPGATDPGATRMGAQDPGATRMGPPVTDPGATRMGAAPAWPQRIGNYRIVGVVGAGGMGTVLRARHIVDAWAEKQGGDVAIKLIHPHLASDPVFQRRFIDEAGLGKDVRHAGLVPVHDVVADGAWLGSVMGFVAGEPLSARVRPEGLPVEEVVRLLGPVGETLDFLHAQGIVHRDVKPANIVVRADGRPVLLDLGIAKDTRAGGESHTRTMTAMGTSAWMAPEQTDAKNVDGAADRYSFGLIAYALLAGRMPWGADTSELSVVVKKATGQIEALGGVRSGLPAHVVAAVTKMLSVSPGERYPTCAAFVQALGREGVFAAFRGSALLDSTEDFERAVRDRAARSKAERELGESAAADTPAPLAPRPTIVSDMLLTMPALSPTMVEGVLASWAVPEGAEVAAGSVVAVVETDKATAEVEVFERGFLRRFLVQPGQSVPVGAPIAIFTRTKDADISALLVELGLGPSGPEVDWVDVVVPSMGDSVTSATILRWLARTGDHVAFDAPIVEIDTDKASIELPAPASGLLEILVAEGAEVRIGQTVARIAVSEGARAQSKQAREREVRAFAASDEPERALIGSAASSAAIEQEACPVATSGHVSSMDPLKYVVHARKSKFFGFGSKEVHEKFTMVVVPPCRFVMGSPSNERHRANDERQHDVRLTRTFAIGTTLVTQALYELVMGNNPSVLKDGIEAPQRPVEAVNWYDATRFCNALSAKLGMQKSYEIGSGDVPTVRLIAGADGFRLPTEAEWECAARSGSGRVYAGDDVLTVVGWFDENSADATHAVGGKRANAWGLHDMSGNVEEWCQDWYGPYPQGTLRDPVGPDAGECRVSRGGSWTSSAEMARVSYRSQNDPRHATVFIGFRLARTIL